MSTFTHLLSNALADLDVVDKLLRTPLEDTPMLRAELQSLLPTASGDLWRMLLTEAKISHHHHWPTIEQMLPDIEHRLIATGDLDNLKKIHKTTGVLVYDPLGIALSVLYDHPKIFLHLTKRAKFYWNEQDQAKALLLAWETQQPRIDALNEVFEKILAVQQSVVVNHMLHTMPMVVVEKSIDEVCRRANVDDPPSMKLCAHVLFVLSNNVSLKKEFDPLRAKVRNVHHRLQATICHDIVAGHRRFGNR